MGRMMRMQTEDPPMYDRFDLLMEGNTKDLVVNSNFSDFVCNAYETIKKIQDTDDVKFKRISKDDIVRCTGVRRTNAYDLASINGLSGVALYPTYSLMNSHCYCNTRCTINPETFVIEV